MRRNENNHVIDLLFTLTLFGVFAVSALLVVIFGAKIYQNTSASMNRNFTSRTAISYVSEKLHQRDVIGSSVITDVEGAPSISLMKQYDSMVVTTYIYADDGYLKEITVTGGVSPVRSSGQNIMELSDFYIEEVTEGVYHMTVIDIDGSMQDAYISAKCDPDLRGDAISGPDDSAMAGPDDSAMAGPSE